MSDTGGSHDRSRRYSFVFLCISYVSMLCHSSDGFLIRQSATTNVWASQRHHSPPSSPKIAVRNLVAPLAMVAKSGGKIITSEEQFTSEVTSSTLSRPVMVFFTAPWCGPCRLSIPVVKEVMKEYGNKIDLVEVCTDDFPEVAADAGVVSIPTIQLYYKGTPRDTIVGCVAKKVLSTAIGKVLEDVQKEGARP